MTWNILEDGTSDEGSKKNGRNMLERNVNLLQLVETSCGKLQTLVDSGADANFVSKDWVHRMGMDIEQLEDDLRVRLADGKELDIPGKITLIVYDKPVEFV